MSTKVWVILAIILLLIGAGILAASGVGKSERLAQLDNPGAKLLLAALLASLGILLFPVLGKIRRGWGRHFDLDELPVVFSAAVFILEGVVLFVWFLLERLLHSNPTRLFSYPGRGFLFVVACCIPFLFFFPMPIGGETSRMVYMRTNRVKKDTGRLFGFVYTFGAIIFVGSLLLIWFVSLVIGHYS
jgi:hypothetical protein